MSPAPPSDGQVPQKNRPLVLIAVIASVVVMVFLLATVLVSVFAHRRKQTSRSETVANMRQIVLALIEFESRYGKFPGSDTVAAVQERTSTDLDLGTESSNDFLRQLLATGIVHSETIFHAEIEGARRPDGVMGKGEALKRGECGFVYLANPDGAGNPGRPLLLVGLIPGTDCFDRRKFSSKIVLAKADGSVTWMPVNGAGHVIMSGKNILDPANPIWGGKPPVIAWPEL